MTDSNLDRLIDTGIQIFGVFILLKEVRNDGKILNNLNYKMFSLAELIFHKTEVFPKKMKT